MASEEAASIPPRTVNPIVLRATAPAPVENASGRTPRRNAMDVITIGRKRSLTASRVDLSALLPVNPHFGKFNNQNCIFGSKPDEGNEPYLCIHIVCKAGRNMRVSIAPKAPIGLPAIQKKALTSFRIMPRETEIQSR